MVVLQLLHVACLGTQEHTGWVKATGDGGSSSGEHGGLSAISCPSSTSAATATSSTATAPSTATSSSLLCSHEDLGYLDACLRKQAHSHKVSRLALAAALEEAAGAPSQIPSQIPEDVLCAAAAIHAADHCHAILTIPQQQQQHASLFPLPFVCHTSSTTSAETPSAMTDTTMSTTASAETAAVVMTSEAAMMVDLLSIGHILQRSAAVVGVAADSTTATTTATTTTDATSSTDIIAATTTTITEESIHPSTDPLRAYCSLVRHVLVKGQTPLPLHPLFSSSTTGNDANASGGVESSSSSTTAVAIDRSNLLKQRTSARARSSHHFPISLLSMHLPPLLYQPRTSPISTPYNNPPPTDLITPS